MPDLLVRGVPADLVANLKRRAAAHRRSLQQELLAILEEATVVDAIEAGKLAARVRAKLAATGRQFSNSADLVREDRER